jgi:hypothetical protein
MAWVWNGAAKRYQNTDNGQFLSFGRALDLVDQSLDSSGDRSTRLAELVGNNEISSIDWRDRFRQELKEEYIRQSIFGRGGRDRMTQSDWGAIGRRLQDQYALLDDITARVAEGEFSEGQIKVIQQDYINSARQVYERSKAVSQEVPASLLPAMPGDGSTICVSGCKCSWRFEFTETEILAYWGLERGAKHCTTCLGRARNWNPYRISRVEEAEI